jgi:hypothetical protein
MLSTALWHLWLALYDGVKMGDLVVGYAADECNRITVLLSVSKCVVSLSLAVLTYGRLHAA